MTRPEERKIWERVFYGKEVAKKRERIRARESYREWETLYKKIKGKKIENILLLIWAELDRKKAFGYETNAMYSLESLELFLKDREEKR